ncbi:helix-turn-helix domain-containing protein [Agarilytica rhodophyticola]|uniref:helix-turn-helix domain-containing protein n=1 Tax=Agarilytica rhodophyticola TaxID=1737490 RepID=UPI000B345D63|nr:helix-turn-helix domain-containing protein [Agarilytica rhodophyticola]
MNRKAFIKRSLAETLTLLCESAGLPYYKNNKVNQSQLAKAAGVTQGAISKILSGYTTSPEHYVIEGLANVFDVTTAQVRGENPISSIDGGLEAVKEEMLRDFEMVSPEAQKEILQFIKWKAEQANKNQDDPPAGA